MGIVHGRSALMLRTGVAVVRRTTRVSAPSSSIASVVSETATVKVFPAWTRARATFCPQITITPVALERRCGLRDELTVSRAEATAGKR